MFRLFVKTIPKQPEIAQFSLKVRAVSSGGSLISFPTFGVQALAFQFFCLPHQDQYIRYALTLPVQILMNAIQEKRIFLNEFQNQREKFQCADENDSTSMREAENLLQNNLITLMELCINLLKHLAFDYRSIPTPEKIQQARERFERAQLKRNEYIDLDEADKKIEKLKLEHQNLERKLESLPKKQRALLKKIEQYLSALK